MRVPPVRTLELSLTDDVAQSEAPAVVKLSTAAPMYMNTITTLPGWRVACIGT